MPYGRLWSVGVRVRERIRKGRPLLAGAMSIEFGSPKPSPIPRPHDWVGVGRRAQSVEGGVSVGCAFRRVGSLVVGVRERIGKRVGGYGFGQCREGRG